MESISWKEAFNIALDYKKLNKVTLFMFTDKDCPVCNEFVPGLVELENDYYQVFLIEDGRTMPFPLTSYPVGYVYIPNVPTEMPLLRIGNAPMHLILEDANIQINAMLTGQDYDRVRTDYHNERRIREAAQDLQGV